MVDIGSYSLKAIQIRQKNNQIKLISCYQSIFPVDTVVNGKIKKEKEVKEKLRKTFIKLTYSSKFIVTTVPNDELIIKELKFPEMTADDLEEVIKWNLDDYIPYSIEKARSRYLVYDKNHEQMKVLLAVINREIIENYMNPFNQLKRNPQVINIQPMALVSLLKYQKEINKPVIIVEIGDKSTRILITDSQNIYVLRVIAFGGHKFTELIMQRNDIKFKKAEKIKKRTGHKNTLNNGLIKKLIKKELIPEILHSLKLYEVKKEQDKIKKLYFTGGGAQIEGLKICLENQLSMVCKELLPFKKFDIKDNIDKKKNTEFIICAGLAVSEVLNNES